MTKHFSIEELTRTDTGLPNSPDEWHRHMLYHLSTILERIRRKCGFPLVINSAFRSPEVNSAVGGSRSSYHLSGRACDICVSHLAEYQLDRLVEALWNENPVELIEHPTYIHVAF